MTGDWRISSLQYGSKTGLRREDIREIIRCAVTDSMVTTGDFRTDIGDSVPAPLRFIRLRISGGLSQKMKDSEVLILRRSPPFYRQLASRSLLSVALLGCLPSLDAAVCVMRLHGLFFGTSHAPKEVEFSTNKAPVRIRHCPFFNHIQRAKI